ncbi:LlaJI family restriction endonuclease, partial [bacterium]|nr:LlaJI family restriction endonuclease [bacterium]
GVLSIGNIIIKSFPKYLLSKDEPFDEMKEVLRVLNKYDSEENIIRLYNGYDNQKEFNLLSVCLYIINDYFDNGVYTTEQEIIETNGEGEILWDNTINETFAIIIRNKPYYTELQTRNVDNDELDYIVRLHKCIITDCCNKLKNSDLLDLFDMPYLNLSDDDLDSFGDTDYIIRKLQKELNVQFVTRKRILLKTLCIYLDHKKSFKENLGFSMYGTNSFYAVWEKACAKVFDNKLSIPIGRLNLNVDLHEDYQAMENDKLIDIIEKPTWIAFDSNKEHEVKHTLIPDLISIYELEGGMCFGIFDAKYYNIVLDSNALKNQPGVGDVTKQYLYQLAYNDFIIKHEFKHVKNAFFMPTEDNQSSLVGEAKMDILQGLSNPPLINISVVKLSAKKVFAAYLHNDKFNISEELEFL